MTNLGLKSGFLSQKPLHIFEKVENEGRFCLKSHKITKSFPNFGMENLRLSLSFFESDSRRFDRYNTHLADFPDYRKEAFSISRKEFLLIVDGSSLLATSYYSSLPTAVRKEKDEEKKEQLYPQLLKQDSKGRYVNALESFFHTLFTIMTFQHPSHLAICWDVSRQTFRKELWPSYKSNRTPTPAPLREQFETAYEVCQKLGIFQLRDQEFEADDFVGTLALRFEKQMPVRIFTRDKDYFQLINDRIHVWYGMSDLDKVKTMRKTYQMPSSLPSRVVEINREILKKEFGYAPEDVVMIKSLFGDASDNIPGVTGMGEYRSRILAAHYHSIESLYEELEAAASRKKKQQLNRKWKDWGISRSPYAVLMKPGNEKRKPAREMAELCYELGRIRTDIELEQYIGKPLQPQVIRYPLSYTRMHQVLAPMGIVLQIGRKPKSPTDRKTSKPAAKKQPKRKPAQNETKKTASTSKTKGKSSRRPTNPKTAQAVQPQNKKRPNRSRPGSKPNPAARNKNRQQPNKPTQTAATVDQPQKNKQTAQNNSQKGNASRKRRRPHRRSGQRQNNTNQNGSKHPSNKPKAS